jgi:hypothetical protein
MGLMAQAPARAETIAIIGTGNVGGALGTEFAQQGHTIVYGSRDASKKEVVDLVARTGNGASAKSQTEAVKGADMVVIAVPGTVAESVVRELGDLSGKIILDPTNRLTTDAEGWRVYGVEKGSNAESIQAAAPRARVVKALNFINFRTMMDPSLAGGPVTVFMAGDDKEAKAVVGKLIEGMGLEVADAGPLRYARVLEEWLAVLTNANTTSGKRQNVYLRPMPN